MRIERGAVSAAVRHEVTCPVLVKPCAELLEIDGRLFQRLQHHLVADLADAHFGALEAKPLGQAHRLAAAVHEQFGGGCHFLHPDRLGYLPMIYITLRASPSIRPELLESARTRDWALTGRVRELDC